MSYPISKAVINAVFERLSASADGFNATFNSIAPDYGLTGNMGIIFSPSGNTSPNFAFANVAPDDWIDTSPVKWPFMTLFADHANNRNMQKFMNFSGDVQIGVNVFLSWEQSFVKLDFDSLASCIEEAMITLFNRARAADPNDQVWGDLETTGADIVYNGGIDCKRSRIERGQQFWTQLLAFKANFEVHSRGEA